jgi:hypothetical protein
LAGKRKDRREERRMRFSIYSEVQYHGGKPYRQLYDEVLEQIVHAERVGFDV